MSGVKQIRYCLLLWLTWLIILIPRPALAAAIQLDGRFEDWEGQAQMDDPTGDATENGDIVYFYWAADTGEKRLYFMIEREGTGENPDPFPLTYRINFDLSDNGHYDNGNDRYVTISYHPFANGIVTVQVYKANNDKLIETYSGDWGEWGADGGRRCEFYVSMDTLKLNPAQPLRMYVESYQVKPDRIPDVGDIQWSPIPILGKAGLAAAGTAVLALLCYNLVKRRKTA